MTDNAFASHQIAAEAEMSAGHALYEKSRMWITQPQKHWSELTDFERLDWDLTATAAKEILHAI